MELDLKRIFLVLWRHWLPLLLAAVVFGSVVFIYNAFFTPPTYRSSALLYVTSDPNSSSAVSQTQLSASKALVQTYISVLKSTPVLEQVAENTSTSRPYTVSQISRLISTQTVGDTSMFYVTVTSENPADSKEFVDALSLYAGPMIKEKINVGSLSVIEPAELPESKAGPAVGRNTLIGALLGFFLLAIVLVLIDLFDLRLRDITEVATELEVPLLGTVEDYSAIIEKKGGKK